MFEIEPLPIPERKDRIAVLARVKQHRKAAVEWLTDRVDDDGRPDGSDTTNSWWRAPWALTIAGAPDVAAAMLGWAEREALQDDGDFREGPFRAGGIAGSPVYGLSPIAIAAWLLGRYDTAGAVARQMRRYQDPVTGGVLDDRFGEPGASRHQDNLKTSQFGFSALVMGDRESAEGVATWLRTTYDLQPELPSRYYPTRSGMELVTEYPEERALMHVVDMTAPRQLYYHPGIAAAFLGGWAQHTGDADVLELGRSYLAISTNGTDAQFDDQASVQICKYGWGAAAMAVADPQGGHLPEVLRMANWFCDRQRPDGSWAPSSWITPEPGSMDYYWKTAEHTMELAYLEQALTSERP
ncbi:hypothetical protein [Rhodococcoides fascians]|uniref:hypothetical protein n=1 Tax=Rhodococcoides fascians TaxID=1828 RepID=UPI00055EC4B9|nr:hypothetical protein [Rhodococcus fascians]